MGASDIRDELRNIADGIEREFEQARRVLSFDEYLELVASDPARLTRDAARYVRDMFDFFGREEVKRPWGTQTRFRLFDQEFLEDDEAAGEALIGQEVVQSEVFRVLNNFVREGRPNRLILLHGPNGSSKSTVLACMQRALEHYSSLPEGALYCFHWVFPNQGKLRGSIGFSGKQAGGIDTESYAHLPDDRIDARLQIEVRDHPLFLLPQRQRRDLIARLHEGAGLSPHLSRWIERGNMSHKSRQVFEALLTSYSGSLKEVLRHVRVERYFISRRYRVGAVTLGPQLSVDAGERQVTADRSLGSLPASLQSVALFEAHGELLDAAGGMIEFSDLLKRPLDAFKYLQITAETGVVSLGSQNIDLNCVLTGSGNEVHLSAFREHPEYESFRGRFEMIRVPYLRDYNEEVAIYDAQVAAHTPGHVAPHATRLAAMFAVLTRMRRPDASRFGPKLKPLIEKLTAVQKMELYASGTAPEGFDDEAAAHLRGVVHDLYHESDTYPVYEGSIGASPREMRTLLLDAAQNPHYDCLSPFAVLEALDELCGRTSEYQFLQEDARTGGYHDTKTFRAFLREQLLGWLEDEFRIASGLVDEARYLELFDRYITHVSYWTKGEKVRNALTGEHEDPDPRLMDDVEALLGAPKDREGLRHSLINLIAAWAIDHPGEPIKNERVFGEHLKRMRNSVFAERRKVLARLCRDVVILLKDEGRGLDSDRRKAAQTLADSLKSRFSYEDSSVADAAVALMQEKFRDLLD